ncbi:MAG: hypothetical protein AAB401_19515, partial [Acidobacteriota bacterium]
MFEIDLDLLHNSPSQRLCEKPVLSNGLIRKISNPILKHRFERSKLQKMFSERISKHRLQLLGATQTFKREFTMTNALQQGKRALAVSVALATIAWAMGLATLIAPLSARAATLTSGSLIKGSLPAVYYYGGDGKRYVFPNEKTYKTWYADFSTVQAISDAELASIQIGGNATYRPAKAMVKITTDPKVYAVSKGGTLRWVSSEAVAIALYGANWNKMIDDVPDAFFTNYKIGADITATSQFNTSAELAAAASINDDKG